MKIDSIALPAFPLLLAPMEDVSDPPFRAVCKGLGADLLYTEFISSEGLIRDAVRCRKKLDIFNEERPVGIQIFGGDEQQLAMAASIVETAGPDFLDINFGCPVKGIVCKGAGAGVLRDVDLMVRLTKAVVSSTSLPVTVKTRLGWDDATINIEVVAERLQDAGIKALTIHGRTRCQLYKGAADWTLIGKVKNNPRIYIPIFGNGDIDSPQKAMEYRNRYGVDGIMIGRAAICNPWIFREVRHFMETGTEAAPPSPEEWLAVCQQHLSKAVEWEGVKKGVNEMRGRYAKYLRGLPDAGIFIKKLVTMATVGEIQHCLEAMKTHYRGYTTERVPVELIDYHQHHTA